MPFYFNPKKLLGVLLLVILVQADTPIFTSTPDTNATINTEWRYNIEAEDPDGDVLSYFTVGDLPSWLSLDNETVGVVTTLAGDGTGNIFDCPTGIAIDTDGNLFVTTLYDHYIRKVTPEGEVSIFAGTGRVGSADGVGTEASFNGPIDIEIDRDNNLYISDYYNNSIRKITPDAVVTTYAGTDSGYADGNGVNAMFAHPVSIAVDTFGNLFVCDYYNNLIRKVDTNREVTTVVGNLQGGFVNGVGLDARLARPTSIDIDKQGNLYVADRYNECIRKITPAMEVTTLAGNGYAGYADGAGDVAQFNYPRGVAVDDDGFVYVADLINNLVRRVTPEGVVSTFVGSVNGYADGTGANALLNHPAGFGIVGSEIVYLADRENQRIRKISLKENPVLVGTPTEREEVAVTVRATDGNIPTDQLFTIDVKGTDQTITFGSLASVTYGDSDFDLVASTTSNLDITFTSSNEDIAMVSGNTITIVGAGNVAITASQAGNGIYEPAENIVQQLIVNKKPITITGISAEDKIYDGNVNAVVSNGSLSGIINSDNVIIVNGTATFSNKNVGTDKEITISGYTTSGDDNWKYELSSQPTVNNASVTKKTITVTSVAISNKVYDGNTDANFESGTLDGVIANDDVSLTSISASFENKMVGENKDVTVAGCALTGIDSDNYSLSSNDFVSTANITAKEISISGLVVDDKIYDGTSSTTFSGNLLLEGSIVNDDVAIVNGTGTFPNKNVGENKDVTVTGFALSGNDAVNYKLNQPTSLTADITAKTVIIENVSVSDKIYDGTITATATGGEIPGMISGDDLTIVNGSATFSDKNVGSDKVITINGYALSGTDNINYTLSSQPIVSTANITKRTISVSSISVDDKIYDGTPSSEVKEFEVTNSIINDDIGVEFSNVVFEDKNVGTNKIVSTSDYVLTGSDGSNYSLSGVLVSTTASITPILLNISGLSVADKEYDGTVAATPEGSAILSGAIDGDVVNFSFTSLEFEDKGIGSSKNIVITGASLTGDDKANYAIATLGDIFGNITPKTLVLSSALVEDKEYDATIDAVVTNVSVSGIVTGDSIVVESSTALFSDKNVGENKNVAVSGGTLTGRGFENYQLSSNYVLTTASITSKAIDISGLSVAEKLYDGTTNATLSGIAAVNGVISGDNVSVLIGSAAFENKNADTLKNVIITGSSISGTDAQNYELEDTTVLTSKITPLGITISNVAANNKEYDRSNVATVNGGVLNDIIYGDTVSINYGVASFLDYSVGKGKNLVASGFGVIGKDASNYILLEQPTIRRAEITPKQIAISNVFAQNKKYDGTNSATVSGGVLSGVIAGDNVTFIPGNATFIDSSVGIGKSVTITNYTLSGEDKDSYVLASQPVVNVANITPQRLTIIADDKIKNAGETDPVFTVTYEGFVEGEDFSVISGLTITREAGEVPGEYYIIPSGALSNNYDITYYDGILTIDYVTEIEAGDKVATDIKGTKIIPVKNPMSIKEDEYKLLINSEYPAEVKLKIYDNLGNELDSQRGFSSIENGRYFSWDMRNDNGIKVAPGSYVVVSKFKFNDGSEKVQKKFININR